MDDVTEPNYDLCVTFRTPRVDLLISLVGPYLAVVGPGGPAFDLERDEFVKAAIHCGLRLVTPAELVTHVPFTDIDTGTTSTPLYKMLFTLADRSFDG